MISITENIAKLGVPIPKKILSVLCSMNKEFIKSFSFGMSAEEIADVEEVSVEEIKQIQIKYADDINRQITRSNLELVYRGQFLML